MGGRAWKTTPRPGRPVTVTTPETIAKIHGIIMADRRVTERYIAIELGISRERVHTVIHNELQMSRVSARWVPKLLSADQKRTRHNMSKDNLAIFKANPASFLLRFVTVDETWVHNFQPESKQQSKQWKHPDSPAPKKTVEHFLSDKDSGFYAEGIRMLHDRWTKCVSVEGDYVEK